jgi:hypothetical protein
MRGDIIQDQFGWFFRDNGDGTLDDLSKPSKNGTPKITFVEGPTQILIRDNKPTGAGDRLAVRVATTLARRYA